MDFDSWIGKEETLEDEVTPEMMARFRATVGVDSGLPEDVAPAGFHWCVCLPKAPMEKLSGDGHPVKGDFLPPVPLPRRMWAASDMAFHGSIKAGAKIRRTQRIMSITEKDGSTGPLVFVEVAHETMADGELAVSERQSIVYRDAAKEQMKLPAGEGADLSDWPLHQSLTPEPPLLFRYSALTFNTHRIHYDQPYTMETEGYPGLVVHGPLTATLLLRLAAGKLGPQNIGRFTFRAKSPAFAGQALHLAAKEEGKGLALAALGADGRTVMAGEAHPRP